MNSNDRQDELSQIIELEEREASHQPERAHARGGIFSPLMRTIQNNRALKGATAAVALTGTLAACAKEPEVHDYTSCIAKYDDAKFCRGEDDKAREIHEATAPQYANREECERTHADTTQKERSEACERKTHGTGYIYRPLYTHYYGGGGTYHPVYPTRGPGDDEPRFKPSVRNTAAQDIKPMPMSQYTRAPGKSLVPAVGNRTGGGGFSAGRGGASS